MHCSRRWLFLFLAGCFSPLAAFTQIDPYPRALIQLGYNQALEGHAPLAGYAFYYRNQPHFYATNLTLRLAVAPVYLDSELGISHALGENTDLGIGLAGGGFADSYDEIRGGTFYPGESFTGDTAESSVSLYHLFNPTQRIPLNGILRGALHGSFYSRDDETDSGFRVPDNRLAGIVKAGLRWGGKEPLLYPSLAMEISLWYEGQLRSTDEAYGFSTNQFHVQSVSHLFWTQALLAYTLPESQQNIYLDVIAGSSIDADHFSAYRLGALLPLASEFPLNLPGYYYQEISARNFVLAGGNYILPLDPKKRWNLSVTATTAFVDYLPGEGQPGNWHNGVGGGVLYQSPSFKLMVGYAYGVDAIRSHGRGANSIGFLMQFDLERAREILNLNPNGSRGLQKILGVFGS